MLEKAAVCTDAACDLYLAVFLSRGAGALRPISSSYPKRGMNDAYLSLS